MNTQSQNLDFTSNQTNVLTNLLQNQGKYEFDELVAQLAGATSKKSFLVFNQNKYFTVPVESIAFFQVKYDSSVLVCLNGKQYSVNHSLDQIQHLLNIKQFFRLNRQYLVNFSAIKEVEHYFARKLLVKLTIGTTENMLVPRERAQHFLSWLENR